MKLMVIGATGATGEQLVRQALAAGHEVSVVVRQPEAVGPIQPGLEVVAGDVLHPASLSEPMAAVDAVVSALGSREGNRATTVYSAGTAAALTAMQEAGVRRLSPSVRPRSPPTSRRARSTATSCTLCCIGSSAAATTTWPGWKTCSRPATGTGRCFGHPA